MFELAALVASGAYCYLAAGGVPSFWSAGVSVKIAMVTFIVLAVYEVVRLVFGDPLTKQRAFLKTLGSQEKKRQINVNEWIDGYNALHHNSDYVKEVSSFHFERLAHCRAFPPP